jgi:cell division GTPase FtsZ
MGGATARGAAPVVAKIAKQQGAMAVAVAATPNSLPARQASDQVCSQSQGALSRSKAKAHFA